MSRFADGSTRLALQGSTIACLPEQKIFLFLRISLILRRLEALLPIGTAPQLAAVYYNYGTLYAGSAEPLSNTNCPRNVPKTGWGPRGDSGPERDRVRATQPAYSLFYRLPRKPALPPANRCRQAQLAM